MQQPAESIAVAPAQPTVPRHLALIMDGNGRWARARNLSRVEGHRAGAQAARRTMEFCLEAGVRYLTLYAFSTENWRRPELEVRALIELLRTQLANRDTMLPEGVRVRFIGRRAALDRDLQGRMARFERPRRGAERLLVSIAFNYGGRAEIVDAVRRLVRAAQSGDVTADEIDEARFGATLDTAGVPDPDVIVRTAREHRISNFLLWQAAYAEFVFLDCQWPDFERRHFDSVLDSFAERERRFGAVSIR